MGPRQPLMCSVPTSAKSAAPLNSPFRFPSGKKPSPLPTQAPSNRDPAILRHVTTERDILGDGHRHPQAPRKPGQGERPAAWCTSGDVVQVLISTRPPGQQPGMTRLLTGLPGFIYALQLISQVPCIVLAQRVDEIQHPALPAFQVLVKLIDGRLAPPHFLPGVKLILNETHSGSKGGSGLELKQLYILPALYIGEGACQDSEKQGITLSASVRQLRESASDATRMCLKFLRFFKM